MEQSRFDGVIPKPGALQPGEGPGAQWQCTMGEPKHFYVYIMASNSRHHVLYTGVTGNLSRRVFEHKRKLIPGFTSKYNVTRLVYYEMFCYSDMAIAREKEIKGWRRNKKITLIEGMNPHWYDLASQWEDVYKPDPGVVGTARRVLRGLNGHSG